jgi:hypothetical protein
MYQLN